MQVNTFNTTEKKLRAIIFCNPADPHSGKTALKYSHVYNSYSNGVNAFLALAKGFHTAQYINFYSKKTGLYVGRIYLRDDYTNEKNTKMEKMLTKKQVEKLPTVPAATVPHQEIFLIPISCPIPCSPSDWCKGGKCDKNGCMNEITENDNPENIYT